MLKGGTISVHSLKGEREKFYPVLREGGGVKKFRTRNFPILYPPPPSPPLPVINDQSLKTRHEHFTPSTCLPPNHRSITMGMPWRFVTLVRNSTNCKVKLPTRRACVPRAGETFTFHRVSNLTSVNSRTLARRNFSC